MLKDNLKFWPILMENCPNFLKFACRYDLLGRELDTHNQHIDTVIMAAGNAIIESRTPHSIEVQCSSMNHDTIQNFQIEGNRVYGIFSGKGHKFQSIRSKKAPFSRF